MTYKLNSSSLSLAMTSFMEIVLVFKQNKKYILLNLNKLLKLGTCYDFYDGQIGHSIGVHT
jgi:hypothetical protein